MFEIIAMGEGVDHKFSQGVWGQLVKVPSLDALEYAAHVDLGQYVLVRFFDLFVDGAGEFTAINENGLCVPLEHAAFYTCRKRPVAGQQRIRVGCNPAVPHLGNDAPCLKLVGRDFLDRLAFRLAPGVVSRDAVHIGA